MAKRLKYLHYKLVPLWETISITEDAGPVEVTLDGFRCVATANGLQAEPLENYTDEAEARSALHGALQAWSATSELIDTIPLTFEFQAASYEDELDKDRPTGDMVHVLIDTAVGTDAGAVAKNNLPEPHPAVRCEGPVTAQLRPRWRNVLQGNESLTAVAYFILTSAEFRFGGRKAVAKDLDISDGVLRRLGTLCGVGDPVHGRKLSKQGIGSLSDEQLTWITAVCPEILRRLMLFEAGADLPGTLTNDDLPPVS